MEQPKLISELPEETSPSLNSFTVIEDGTSTKSIKWSTVKALFGIGGAVWGAITGTLSDQTDLQSALYDKLNKSGSNADQDIDVGNYAVNAKSFKANGTNGNGKVGLKHQASDASASASESVIYAASDGELYVKNDGNAKQKLTTASDLSSGLSGKEDTSNKVTTFTGNETSTTKFPVVKAILDYFTASNIRTILGITTLSGSNTGDQDLSGLVVKNATITGATKTKITYDSKGLVTSGADATTADIADSTDKRYVTDAQRTVISNTSGTNTGDNATNSQYSGLATSKQDALVSGTNIKTVNNTTLLGSGNLDASIGLIESISFEDSNTSISSQTYVLELYASYAYNINQLKIKSASGTCTAAVYINSTPVTGISAVSVSSTIATGTASAANAVAVGDKVSLVITSTSSLADLQASIKTTRT